MSSTWLTPAQACGLPGMPGSERRTRDKLNRLAAPDQVRRRQQGKGKEYRSDCLPPEAQVQVAHQQAAELATTDAAFISGKAVATQKQSDDQQSFEQRQQQREASAAAMMQLSERGADRACAKTAIVAAFRAFVGPYAQAKRKMEGVNRFIDAFNQRSLSLREEVYQQVRTINRATLYRWNSLFEAHGSAALAGRYQREEGASKIERQPDMLSYCKGVLYHQPDITPRLLFQLIASKSQVEGLEWDLPSESACRRWLTAFAQANPLLMHQLRAPDDFKNKRQVAWGRMGEDVIRVNQVWELDSTPSDVLLTDGRYSIVGMIDVYSRRPLVVVVPTSSAATVSQLLRKALLTLGVPETVVTDNGKDYVSRRIESILLNVGVQQCLTKPFHGDEKPFIERFFRTWAHGISTLLPGYGGHNVAKRQEIRSRRSFAERIMAKGSSEQIEVSLSSKELQLVIDDWIENLYLHNRHRSLGMSPMQRWQSCTLPLQTIGNPRSLDLLLTPVAAQSGRPAGERTINKDAGIVVEGLSYLAPELAPMIGETVFVSHDPDEVGRVMVFERTSMAFLCVAECPQLADSGLSLSELTAQAKAMQRATLTEKRKELRQAGKAVNPGEMAQQIVQAAKLRNQGITAFPKSQQPHSSSALTGAQTAAGVELNKRPAMSDEERAAFAERRQQQLRAESALKQSGTKASAFRSEEDEAKYLLRQAQRRELLEEEKAKLAKFRNKNPDLMQVIERMVGTPNLSKVNQ
ncbi:DDE-type integrase/transposase/recombinase [Ferrimonas sp.]|uniref:DDE-type integrase/transposase/recombinase n=1 Tax=Ferrimonas sp. TaxID=2080861 RepID=UPI003A959255